MERDGSVDVERDSRVKSYNEQKSLNGSPGGVYCIRRKTLETIGWFNYLPFGGGDDLFFCEITGKTVGLLSKLCKRSIVLDVITDICKEMRMKLMGYINCPVYHFYHGERKNRSYGHRQYILMT